MIASWWCLSQGLDVSRLSDDEGAMWAGDREAVPEAALAGQGLLDARTCKEFQRCVRVRGSADRTSFQCI